jgi:hypothetical protein
MKYMQASCTEHPSNSLLKFDFLRTMAELMQGAEIHSLVYPAPQTHDPDFPRTI